MPSRRSPVSCGRAAQAYWTFVRPDGSRSGLSFDHRLYSPADYGRLLRRAGLEPERWFGSFDGSALELDSWRLIVLARRG